MRIFVKARPGSYKEFVEQVDETHFIVAVREPPENGLANRVIRKALANHLKIPQTEIELVSGFSSQHKIFRVG